MKQRAALKNNKSERTFSPGKVKATIEICLVLITALGLFYGLYRAGGGPKFSDELLYMQLGLNRVKDFTQLNRYFHVYLQSIFMELANTPLGGVRLFWSAEITFTMLLIYLSARFFSRKNGVLHGAVSALFFLSLPFFQTHVGDTIVDFSAMMMATLFFTIYLFSFRPGRLGKWMQVALGMVFFLAFKTKETTLVIGYALVGFGFDEDGSFRWRILWSRLRLFLVGIFIGVGLFILLNSVFLGDPWFGFRLSEFQSFSSGYGFMFSTGHVQNTDYLNTMVVDFLVIFLLYLLGGVRTMERYPNHRKLVWLYPLLLLASIIIVMLNSKYEVLRRIYFPALPMLCILASQFLEVEWSTTVREKLKTLIALVAGGIVFGFGLFLIPKLANTFGWEYAEFSTLVVGQLVLMALLGLLLVKKHYSHKTIVLPLVLLVFLIAIPIRANVQSLVLERPVEKAVELRFYPFSQFKADIQFSASMRMEISSNILKENYMLSNNVDDLLGMFNVYFDTSATRENFSYASTPGQLAEDAINNNPQYLLMIKDDWFKIIANKELQTKIEERYSVLTDENDLLRLLILK